ncbi:cupin domain-containing protein [Serratia marcescens]|nr:cupin domain-containing protein [Serratia marcescens]
MQSNENKIKFGEVVIKILSNSDELTVSELYFPAGIVAKIHSHPHEEVNYVISGELYFMCDGESKTLLPGDVMRIPPNILHNIKCSEKSDGKVITVWTPSRKDLIEKIK